ncbi:siderophore-interacting protein [Gelidibacter maritimus]|uniref:Siderophore-interacting protein n=1 Tax=Gelidibacter maritimus TaxID=2761487 RepID=A0A7W2M5J3_9FLAO|nr:siderophore-interacting protein [Gelidibacter maritimus]MBA6153128.1 siderophore-interacting protein [Gelidibacter maritimus]
MNENKYPQAIRSVFTVTRKTYITPTYIRVFLTGENVHLIAKTTVGANNKILIPPPGIEEIHFPKWDAYSEAWIAPSESLRPIVRTYTHRGIDLASNEIWIDFIAHGDEGPASAWAISAKKGDSLGIMMKREKKELFPQVDSYFLVGDATALPVLSVILEQLPANAEGVAIIEVNSKADEQVLSTKADIQTIWVHNKEPQNGSQLAQSAKMLELPTTSRFAYIAAEFATVKELRNYFRKEKHWSTEELYAYSYWKAGVSEDRSVTDRRKESVAS